LEQYQNIIKSILEEGNYKPNRTAVDTISKFGHFFKVNVSEGYPLLTTKDLSGYRWNSLIHEILWYFSGEEHIKNLREHTKIWNAWADDEGLLPTAYGRFWRRYPIPEEDARLEGEWWPVENDEWLNKAVKHYGGDSEEVEEAMNRWVTEEEDGRKVFDQIQYVIDTLNGDHPHRGPESRRLIINAWHPANAAVSKLPPCHYTFVFNVQGGKLNLHLTQRSADVALGVPFNIACYCLILKIIAKQTDFEVGEFAHTLVDAHLYCGKGERGEWYGENMEKLREKVESVEERQEYLEVKEWIEEKAPEEGEEKEGYDHIPNLLKQLSREPREKPKIKVPGKDIDELGYDDFELEDYNPHPGLKFSVAE